jgi:hypothetical protein
MPYAITSLTALIGISMALIGGIGIEASDKRAAQLACGIFFFNGLRSLIQHWTKSWMLRLLLTSKVKLLLLPPQLRIVEYVRVA